MINIIGIGDIMPGGMLTGNNSFVDNEVLDILHSADVRIGTLETAIGNSPTWLDEKMQRLGDVIYTKDVDLDKLITLNVDIVSLANNHVFDLGPDGIRHTIEVLDSLGIKHCGAGMNLEEASRPVVLEFDGKSIAIVAFCDWRPETTGWCLMASEESAGVNPLYDKHVEQQIKMLKSRYNYVIVIPHWGKEHTFWPTKSVYLLANKMIKWGADIVLGGHPHRIQPLITKRKRCIVYSLGNFCFIDRIIVHPRSTWYPDDISSFDINSIPKTYDYPYVNEPTLKCSPPVNRIGSIVSLSINGQCVKGTSYLTFMNDKCRIQLYHGKNPLGFVKACLGSGLYPIILFLRNTFLTTFALAKVAFHKVFHLKSD